MTHKQAHEHQQSILYVGQTLANALNELDWEKATDALDMLETDLSRLREYVNGKLMESEK